jgi:AGCS family alanine or glycine:cation symporter
MVVSISLVLFAFTTILSWSVYGERCAAFLVGVRVIRPYRVVWCIVASLGAIIHLDVAWLIADITNALMALPNLIALILLSPMIFKATRDRLAGGRPLVAPAHTPLPSPP